MNRLCRPSIVAAFGIGLAASAASVASANVEIGGTAGIHVFSSNNELGVPDVADAPSERNSALFGLRLGGMFNDMLGVEGDVKGNLSANDRIELKSTARYEGDLRASKLTVDEGAVFSGHVTVGPEAVKGGKPGAPGVGAGAPPRVGQTGPAQPQGQPVK